MLKNLRFFATLTLSSVPSAAKIFLNDQLINNVVTPTIIRNVYPGKYELKLSKKDCRDDSLTIAIQGGEHADILRILEDTSRTVSYRTNNSKITTNQINKIVVDKFNNKWFLNDSTIYKIKEDKIKEGDILKVKFGYRDMVNYDYILDYEIIKQN